MINTIDSNELSVNIYTDLYPCLLRDNIIYDGVNRWELDEELIRKLNIRPRSVKMGDYIIRRLETTLSRSIYTATETHIKLGIKTYVRKTNNK